MGLALFLIDPIVFGSFSFIMGEQGTSFIASSPFLMAFMIAFFAAGVREEVLKSLTVFDSFNYKSIFVLDPRALMVYGACAGVAFTGVENLL